MGAGKDQTGSAPEFLREAQIVPHLIPVSKATFRRWVRDGRFPAGIKLSSRITVWRTREVGAWIERAGVATEVRQP